MSSVLFLLLACKDDAKDDSAGPRFVGPELAHTAPTSAIAGSPLDLAVSASDEDGVANVSLFFRTEGGTDWSNLPLAQDGESWSTTVDGADIVAPGFEYYFKATDGGETPAVSYLPEGSTGAPYVLPVSVVGLPLPYTTDFELVEGQSGLPDLGWGSASTSFRGYPWELSAVRSNGAGATSAFHPRGVDGTQASKDWLVSPALDFSGVTDAQVSWWEYGVDVVDARHALYASTGRRDPADGDYVLVADLAAPVEGEWARPTPIDLTSLSGQPTVYLAWYFEGVDADDWFVDDVRVGARLPDLEFDWTAGTVAPGGTTTLSATITNVSDLAADAVVLGVAFPDGGATVDPAEQTVASLAGGTATTLDFAVTVDAATPDDSYVPVQLSLAWGDSVLELDDRLLVGDASIAHVGWSSGGVGALDVVLGVGDPDDPTFETTVYTGRSVVGETTWDVDLTDQGALLPPAPGDLRWYLRVTSEAAGSVTAFDITDDGVTSSASVLPVVTAGSEGLAWLPEPPALSLSVSTSPSEIDPGAAGVGLTVTLSNDGAATAGPVTVSLASSDADVTVVEGGPLELGGDLGSGERVALSGFLFDVAPTHVDSSPLSLSLVVSDGVESWEFPAQVAVPYPVLRVTYIEVDDDGRDGMIDPGESAELTLDLTNVGDESTSGNLSVVLSVEASSTASATITEAVQSYSTLTPNTTRDSRAFELTLDSGGPGDWLDLLLTSTDSARSYESRFRIYVSEPPWQALDTSEDDVGDVIDGWQFDLVRGEYRAYGDLLQIRITSDTPLDASDLFIEAWGLSSGADWLYYRLVLQSGSADLQGYDSSAGFLPINEPSVSYPDAYTVQFDLVIAEMGLFLDTISMGFASGWCGPPDYYCDHYPNAWGYPYDSFSTANWFELSW